MDMIGRVWGDVWSQGCDLPVWVSNTLCDWLYPPDLEYSLLYPVWQIGFYTIVFECSVCYNNFPYLPKPAALITLILIPNSTIT